MNVEQVIADIKAWGEELLAGGRVNAANMAHNAAQMLDTANQVDTQPAPPEGEPGGLPPAPGAETVEPVSDASGQPAQTGSEIHGRATDDQQASNE
jgi:hypothetical protein